MQMSCGAQKHNPPGTRARHSMGVPYVGCMYTCCGGGHGCCFSVLLWCAGGQGWPLGSCWPSHGCCQLLVGGVVPCPAVSPSGGTGVIGALSRVCPLVLTDQREFRNGTHQSLHYYGSLRLQKWLPRASQSLGSILTGSCSLVDTSRLTSGCPSIVYEPFNLEILHCFSG